MLGLEVGLRLLGLRLRIGLRLRGLRLIGLRLIWANA